MRSSGQLLVVAMLWPLSTASAADGALVADAARPDTSQWKCESCPFEKGVTGEVAAGVGSVSNHSAKFGEYTGIQKSDASLNADGEARYRGTDAKYWNIGVSNLGLRSRSIDVEGGQQGAFKLLFNYDELPHYTADSARTPFLGTGSASLALPQGFPAPTTAQMPLATALHDVDLDTRRKALGVGGAWTMGGLTYAVGFRHETKEGTKPMAGAFFVNAAQLVAPVDYTTDQVNASVSYAGARWLVKLDYYGSIFRNDNSSLTWKNPFTLPAAASGQLALPPGNEFHQLRAAAEYQFSPDTRAFGDIAYGRGTQNEGFLAPTLNAGLAVPGLPRGSLDGRVNTLDANVKLVSQVTREVRLSAAYARNDRDNRTPQAAYSWVTTDMFGAAPRTNLPYGFTQDRVKLSADYRPAAKIKGTLGYDYDRIDRTYQEVDGTREHTIWGRVLSKATENLDLSLKLVHAQRDRSDYHPVPGLAPPENPSLRKYNLADRRREGADLRADILAGDNLTIGLGLAKYRDSFTDSPVGLKAGSDLSLNADVAFTVTDDFTTHLFGGYEVLKSQQAGSQGFAVPDWAATNRDKIDFIGAGARYAVIKGKLDLGADYTRAFTRSAVVVDSGVNTPFPDMTTSRQSVKLYADYLLSPKLRLNASYWYERYRSANWMLDNVTASTIPNVLTLGMEPPRYTANVFRISARFEF